MEINQLLLKLRSVTVADSPLTLQNLITEAANEIQRLHLLTAQLLPFMLNDMEDGLRIGPYDHEEEEPCGDCIWFKEASYWKKRVDAGDFKDYI